MRNVRSLQIELDSGNLLNLTYDVDLAIQQGLGLEPQTLDQSDEALDNAAARFLAETILWWDVEDEEGPVPLVPSDILRRLPEGVLETVVHAISQDFQKEPQRRGQNPMPGNGTH